MTTAMSSSPSGPICWCRSPSLKRELSALIARVKAVPRQPGVAEIRIPGEQSARNRQRLSRDGLDIDRLVYDRLGALGG